MTDRELQREVAGYLERRDWKPAVEGLQRLTAANPKNAELLIQLSYAQSFLGKYRAAREAAIAAASSRPGTAGIAKDVISRLRTFNEVGLMKRYLVGLGAPSRLPIPLLLTAAAQYSYTNDQETALAWLDEAKRADPDYPGTMLSRAQVLIYLGRWDEADAELKACMRRAPELPELYRLLAQLRRATPADNHVDRIRALLANPAAKQIDKVRLAYALHKQLDELSDFTGAWEALDLACRTMRAIVNYQSADSRDLFDGLSAMPVSSRAVASSEAPVTPIFIVGMHRSGTTLLEQLLNGSPDVHGVGELYDFTSAMRYATDHHCKGAIDLEIVARAPAVDFAEVGRRYLDGMKWRLESERFFTDKLPSNFLNIAFICQALPNAKILHMVRDPVETCFSNLRELYSDVNPYSYDQVELAEYFLQYRRLMAHWHASFPGRILDVGYSELTRDPVTVMGNVSRFCGIAYVPAMGDPRSSSGRGVATASAVQVRDKVIRREVPKWAPYSEFLEPMVATLNG